MEIKELVKKLEEIASVMIYFSDRIALQAAISHLETLQKVKEAVGVKKLNYAIDGVEPKNVRVYEPAWVEGWNDCLDAVHAELAGKLEGLKEVINKVLRDDILPSGARKWVLHGSYDMFREELSNKIQELILGKKEE